MDESGNYQDMKMAIGSLIVLWVFVERGIEALDPDPPDAAGGRPFPGFATRLTRWQEGLIRKAAGQPFRAALAERLVARLREARRIRNGICHGLHSIHGAHGGAPGQLVWRHGRTEESLSWDALQSQFAWLSKVPGALGILDRGDEGRLGRLQDTTENRGWWAAEFGIDLKA